MMSFELGVEDLADTRFAISPVQETLFSLWALRDPGRHAVHLPWRRSVLGELAAVDTRLLLSLVGGSLALPDFLTPRPETFAPVFEDQLATVRGTSPGLVRRDILATHAGGELPGALRQVTAPGDEPVRELLDAVCEALQHYWDVALKPAWSRMRLVLETDMTYRARRLATGGARLLFADMHPNLRWRDGVLRIDKMIGGHHVAVSGRGLLLIPSLFAYKPVPPLDPAEPPLLAYPCRGAATLWAEAPKADPGALASLLGPPKARLLGLLEEPLPTIEIARRLKVTPSAVSQHLRVLHATGLVSRARDGRQMLYRRSPLGDRLAGPHHSRAM
ncbi:transcriptional regulator [Microtetraspora sp. NBRC 13810]|uniref:ArsR/SmtB family transcription factor n=1 Tax=Microtetraspora sp. NBRC 13810 TaxID=3030990 RepID=UPI0024A44498|nr:ArsR family transcriptional regulator [Microtetraspora sp. NBRC 13810]GLW07508.1 transcriptional regulator [Microtetraspora sp. NBRC 13810]